MSYLQAHASWLGPSGLMGWLVIGNCPANALWGKASLDHLVITEERWNHYIQLGDNYGRLSTKLHCLASFWMGHVARISRRCLALPAPLCQFRVPTLPQPSGIRRARRPGERGPFACAPSCEARHVNLRETQIMRCMLQAETTPLAGRNSSKQP